MGVANVAHFSEESVFIAHNWETVRDILKAVEGLEEDLSAVRNSLARDLERRDWWAAGWRFHEWVEGADVFIARAAWPWRKDHALQVGLERFDGASIFGAADPPQLYVWCPPELTGLVEELVARLEREPDPVVGTLNYQPKSGYVVTELLPPYSSGDLDAYADTIRERALEFIDHYAQRLMRYDRLIRRAAEGNK